MSARWKVPLGDVPGFAAYVFRAMGRGWVGVAPVVGDVRSWDGVWSRAEPVTAADFQSLVLLLEGELVVQERADGAPGRGTVIGHCFFEGWEYWGPGNPAVLLPETAASIAAEAVEAAEVPPLGSEETNG